MGSSDYINLDTGARTVRVVLPSRIRRGRVAVSPVWQTVLTTGEAWQFQTRKRALAFAAAGGCTHGEGASGHCWRSTQCDGHRVTEAGTGRSGETQGQGGET